MRSPLSLLALAAVALIASTAHAQTAIATNPTFPIVLNQSGSYKLSGNLNVPAGIDGIVIGNAANVTLDLNGFQIAGPAVCSKTGCSGASAIGIKIGGNAVARIANGTVKGFALYGIGVDALSPMGVVVAEDLTITGNFNGIFLSQLTAHRVVAQNNAYFGVYASQGLIADSAASNNGGTGLAMGFGLVRDSRAMYNAVGFEHSNGVSQGNTSGGNAHANKFGSLTQFANAFY